MGIRVTINGCDISKETTKNHGDIIDKLKKEFKNYSKSTTHSETYTFNNVIVDIIDDDDD